MSLDPLRTAFAFVQSTTERVSKAISHKEDGKKMLELAKKTETLLLHVSQQDEHKSASQGALKDIAEALEFVDKAVAGCCSRSALLTELLASRDHRKLTEAAKKLECSLAALSLNDMKACPEMRRHFSALMADLRTVEFAQTASYFRPSNLMRTEMERIFSREGGRRIAESIPFEMNNALEEHSRSVAQRLHDLESLRSQLLFAGPKERDEAKKKYDEQMTVEVIFQYLRTLPVKSIDEFQCQLCCPLGKSFMKDPVLLRDSGMTYDRCQIEHWLARGHRTDPVTRQDLVSAELIPNIAIKELVNIFLTADARELSSKKTRETQSLVAGLYEGRGRYIKGDGSMNHVFAVLLLEPDGNVQGYLLSEIPDFGSADDERLIFKGMWNTNTNDLSFDDSHLSNKGSISYKTDSCQLAFDLEGKALPRDQCSSAQEEIAFSICHVTRSPILHHCRIHSGILEMEGAIALGEGQELENSLVLIFEKDLSVRGWMAFKEDDSHTASRYGHVLSGNWNAAGKVHLEIYFLESKTVPLKSETEPMRFLAKFKLNGILYERTDEARTKGPVFQGEMEGSIMGSFDPPLSRTVPTLNIPTGVRVHFSYVHFRAPSRCLSSTTMSGK